MCVTGEGRILGGRPGSPVSGPKPDWQPDSEGNAP